MPEHSPHPRATNSLRKLQNWSFFQYNQHSKIKSIRYWYSTHIHSYANHPRLFEDSQIFIYNSAQWGSSFQWGQSANKRRASQIIRSFFEQSLFTARTVENKKAVLVITEKRKWQCTTSKDKLQLESMAIIKFAFHRWACV